MIRLTTLTAEQRDSYLRSLWKYTAPLFLVFLLSIQAGTPLKDALFVVYGAVLQTAINFLSKVVETGK